MPDPQTTETSQPAAPANAEAPGATTASDKTAGAADSGAPAEPSAKELGEFARHRRGLQQKARELRQGFAQLKDREKAIAERDAAREKELADLRARVEKWERGNPLEHVEDPSATVRDYVEKTGPERRIDQLEKANKALLEKLSTLEKLPEEFEKRQAAEVAKQQQAHAQAIAVEQRRAFTRTVRQRAAEFPYLHAEHEDAEIDAMASEIQEWARTTKWVDEQGRQQIGKQVSFDEAARFLNERAKKVYESRSERRQPIATTPPAGGSGTEHRDKKPPPGNGRRELRPAPATPPKPLRRMTSDDDDARHLQSLRDAMERDRISREKANGASKRS